MKNMDHKQAAQMLWEAEQGRYQIDMLTQTHPEMTVEDAYAVQLENVRRAGGQAGERVVGHEDRPDQRGMQRLLLSWSRITATCLKICCCWSGSPAWCQG